MKTSLRTLIRDIWVLTKPYWKSEDRIKGIALLIVIVGLSLGAVYINVLLNKWNNTFYTALQNKDTVAFWHLMLRFGELAFAAIIVAVYQLYLNQMLQIRWRKWLTDHYLDDWMHKRAYYLMQLTGGESDNPDQRIAEDLREFVGQTLNITLGLLSAVVTLVSFIGILWGLSGVVHIAIGGRDFVLWGSMVWAGLVYAIVGTWITHIVGRPLIGLSYNQQRFEADFRFNLVRLRENAEGVALYGGETGEKQRFSEVFSHVVRNWWDIMRRQKRLTWFTAGYNQLAIIYPFLVAAPRYLAGNFTLGQLMQTASAFGRVQDSLSFFVNAYTGLAQWRSVTQRLRGFQEAVERSRAVVGTQHGVTVTASESPGLQVNAMAVTKPAGEVLLRNLQLELHPGERLLIMGPSGSGKSTLFRLMAGIWPFAQGTVHQPANGTRLFLPQKPYLPIGSLRDTVRYPNTDKVIDDDVIKDILRQVGLDGFVDRLDEEAHWSLRLSPGEQQRLAFARVLVIRPDWLFLDEATSALDETAEASLYQLLIRSLPDTAVISIGHRRTLRQFHERIIELQDRLVETAVGMGDGGLNPVPGY